MKRLDLHVFDEKFLKKPIPFFAQSVLASVFLAITFYLIWNINPLVVAGIGSTTFVLFAIPESSAAQPRAVIGGHIIAMLIGVSFFHVPQVIVAVSLSVGASILLMTITDTEHPPAASTALGVAVDGLNWELLVFIVTATTLLSLFHMGTRKYIENLV